MEQRAELGEVLEALRDAMAELEELENQTSWFVSAAMPRLQEAEQRLMEIIG